MRLIKRLCAFITLLSVLVLSACAAAPAAQQSAPETPQPQRIEPKGKVYYSYFDTVSYVYDYTGDSAERFDERSAEVSHILSDFHRLFDVYHEYSGMNNLCTLNRNAGGEPLEVDERLIDFLLCAREMYALTEGEMNVMLGAVLRLWHDCREAASNDPAGAAIPDRQALEEAARHTDISLLEIDADRRTVRIADSQAAIDVGALGKGYATEQAARFLEDDGACGYVLNIGGNIRCVGARPDGTGWVTAIRDPDRAAEDFARRLRIADTSCVTSGVYERYFTVDGVRYHHIIDKDTLFPADYYDSLTVLCRDSGLADALSTALFCLPYEESRRIAESIDGVEVLWIFPDGEQRCTPGVEQITEEIPS